MRTFSPFAILALLHVARGGELDAFAAERARSIHDRLSGRTVPALSSSNTTSAPTSPVPNVLRRALERRLLTERGVNHLDSNQDGHVEHEEIVKSLAFHWEGQDRARRMLRAFGGGDLEDFMSSNSPEGDGKVPKEILKNILDTAPTREPDYCPAIRTKVESCPTHTVLRCGAYLTAAESFCKAGVQNLIEKCIMSESCDNMCKCITAVEDAAHGDAAIVDNGQLVQVHLNSVGMPESSLMPRNPGVLLAAFVYALIEIIVGITILYILGNILEGLTSANPWLDTVEWDGSGLEPACSSYVFFGGCGAIGSSTARNCPSGAQRVFGNSCKDHFRYGSRGCGFWGLGCQSLCSKVNPKGCPCSLFDWSEFDNQDMPGSDMPNGAFMTSKVSLCRSACAGNATCQAFVMTPFKGNEKDKNPNCYLKTAQRQTQTVEGSTVWFKRSKNGDCGNAPTVKPNVPFDYDWFSTSTGTDKRSLIEGNKTEHAVLVPRADKGEVPFAFDRATSAYLTLRFLQLMYQRIATEFTWRNAPAIQRPIGATTATSSTGGGSTGRPSDAPYLVNRALPQWRPTELAYRVNGIFRQIIQTAIATNADDPVTAWLNQNAPGTAGERSRWPDSVRQLLLSNSRQVHRSGRDIRDTWLYRNRDRGSGEVAPWTNVQAGYDQTMGFYQRGNMGPFSLEAAFIMATQLAGVNFRAVRGLYQSNPAGWWMGVLNSGVSANQCIQENDSAGVPDRIYGRLQTGSGSTQHDPRAGVYMAFDLDPDLPANDANHNVFVFVVHAIDANSVVGATEAQLRAVNVGPSNRWYTPVATGAQFYNRGSPSDTSPTANAQSNTRLLAHAHAAILNRADFENWLNGVTQTFPSYTQISYSHMYILTEDVSLGPNDDPNDYPRKQWFNNGAGGSSS